MKYIIPALTIALLGSPAAAHIAPDQCIATGVLYKILRSENYQEMRTHSGITTTGKNMIEIWQSKDGLMAVVQRNGNGVACLLVKVMAFGPDTTQPPEPKGSGY